MCGIAGFVSTDACAPSDVDAMVASLRHRGPDDRGTWTGEHCRLGHTRLAVIDLSDAGCQPMSDPSGRYTLVYNGEIYNVPELRVELEAHGVRFRSHTDTEVLLQAFAVWGRGCLTRLRGMFAFAIWDSERRELFLARDRVGKKPLFYRADRHGLLFASELQAIRAGSRGESAAVDPIAVDEYMRAGYISAPRSGYAAVRKLPAAHWLAVRVGADGLAVESGEYWRLRYTPKLVVSEAEAVAKLRSEVTEAVELRLVSDVPIGAFLSGGVDSSIVVGVMAQLMSRPVRTFSIGFDNPAYDELDHARRIAKMWGTDHHEEVVAPDAVSLLPTLLRHYGEPFADSSAIPTLYVAELARRDVTVALNGDGGDESFAGYDRYRAHQYAELLNRIPGIRTGATGVARLLPASAGPKSSADRARRFLTALGESAPSRYGRWMASFSESQLAALYRPEFAETVHHGADARATSEALFDDARGLHPVDAAMSVDVRSYLPYDLLVKVDIATMVHSLEARSPLLDHKLMQCAASLPVALKLHRGHAKYLLKRAFPELLPRENVRRRKMGFAVPLDAWFRGPLSTIAQDTIGARTSPLYDYLRHERTSALLDQHMKGAAQHGARLWALLVLDGWLRLQE
jgi:asparagine synthase (glutamine-hydrolysing)